MNVGEILYCVLLGFILIWVADLFHIWARYDAWRENRQRSRRP